MPDLNFSDQFTRLLLVAAAAAAITTLVKAWQVWVYPALRVIGDAIRAAREIADTILEIRKFLTATLPELVGHIEAGSERFNVHERQLDDHELRIGMLEYSNPEDGREHVVEAGYDRSAQE